MKILIRRNVIRYAIGVVVAGVAAVAFEKPVAAVPPCDCDVYNYPNPGDGPIPGVEDETGECFLDPCSS